MSIDTVILAAILLANSHLFIYVDKGDNDSPAAQHMLVFEDGKLEYNWLVSTGQEDLDRDNNGRIELSITPTGYFQIDKHRMYVHYTSQQWDAPMPYAMFLTSEQQPYSGFAIHGVYQTNQLGHRGSHGCINLSFTHAKLLYNMVKAEHNQPVFVYVDDSNR